MAKVKYSHEARTQSGVYAIVNLATGWMYIGQTAFRFSERWTNHCVQLNKNKHNNRLLQEDWNVYGSGVFEFRILQARRLGLDPEIDNLAAERAHIKAAKCPLYNLS